MDSNTVRQLLDKYWEGETSLQEESQLRTYFSQDNIAEEFASVQPMFQYFKNEQEAFLNGDFEERLSSRLKSMDNQKPRVHSLTTYMWRAAAIAAVLIGVVFFFNKGLLDIGPGAETTAMSIEEEEDAKMAYQEAKAALMLISRKMNNGTDKAETGLIQVRKATKVIKN